MICIDWYLPGYKAGGPIRSCANMIAHLKNEFDFFVLTRNTDYLESKSYENIKSNEWNKLHDETSVYYFSNDKLNELGKIIDSTEFDFIYLNGIFSKHFTIFPLKHLKGVKRKKIILSVRGMLAPQALALKPIKKKLFLSYAKFSGLYSGVKFHATNPNEISQIKNIFGNDSSVFLAPNLGRKNLQEIKKPIKEKDKLRIVNIARIAPEKNQLFALNILRDIKSDVVYDLFGPIYKEEYWYECKKTINQLPSNIKVRYHGPLHENKIQKTLSSYDFLFTPSITENFGHIILESLSASTPVIISDNTPWKKLYENKVGWNIPLEKRNDFIAAIETAAQMNNVEFAIWSKSAFACAEKFNSNPENLQQNRNLFL